MEQHVTAGSLALKASLDPTAYYSLEVGHALTEDIAKELKNCAYRHRHIFDEDEYVVFLGFKEEPTPEPEVIDPNEECACGMRRSGCDYHKRT